MSSSKGLNTKTVLQALHRKVKGSDSRKRSLSEICEENVKISFSWNDPLLVFWNRLGSKPAFSYQRRFALTCRQTDPDTLPISHGPSPRYRYKDVRLVAVLAVIGKSRSLIHKVSPCRITISFCVPSFNSESGFLNSSGWYARSACADRAVLPSVPRQNRYGTTSPAFSIVPFCFMRSATCTWGCAPLSG